MQIYSGNYQPHAYVSRPWNSLPYFEHEGLKKEQYWEGKRDV